MLPRYSLYSRGVIELSFLFFFIYVVIKWGARSKITYSALITSWTLAFSDIRGKLDTMGRKGKGRGRGGKSRTFLGEWPVLIWHSMDNVGYKGSECRVLDRRKLYRATEFVVISLYVTIRRILDETSTDSTDCDEFLHSLVRGNDVCSTKFARERIERNIRNDRDDTRGIIFDRWSVYYLTKICSILSILPSPAPLRVIKMIAKNLIINASRLNVFVSVKTTKF